MEKTEIKTSLRIKTIANRIKKEEGIITQTHSLSQIINTILILRIDSPKRNLPKTRIKLLIINLKKLKRLSQGIQTKMTNNRKT